jgi:EmrB/QacA subfamily drug resistance transporter
MTKKIWTLVLTSVAFFMVNLDALVVVTALPAIHRNLGGSMSQLEWTVNAFTLTYAAGIITAASLGDRIGRRLVFVIGLAAFTLASVACASAPNAGLLIASRAVQGLGAAMVMPLSLTILTSAFGPERRGTIVGLWGGIGGLAVAAGPLVGGAITQGVSWHWVFWLNVPIGIVAVFLSLLLLPESKGASTRLDPIAAVLIAAGSALVVWGLIRAGDEGWTSAATLGTLTAGAVLVGGFVIWELRTSDPMLPMRFFANRSFTAASVTGFLMSGTVFSAAFLVAQFMQFAQGQSPLETGLRVLPWTATPLFIAPVAGVIADRVGPRPVMATGMLLQGVGLLWFASLATTGVDYVRLVPALVLAGVGVSLALPIAPTAVVNAVRPQDIGKASGVNSTMQRLGSAFAIALASAIFAANGHIGTAASFAAGFQPALMAVAGLSLAGVVTALGVQRRRPPVVNPVQLAEAA